MPQVALATMQPENEKGEEVPDVCLQRCLLAAESDGSWNLESSSLGRRLGRVPAFRTLDALESWTVSSRVALQMCSPSEARKPLPALPSAPAPGLQQTDRHFSMYQGSLFILIFLASLGKSLVGSISTKF